LGAGEHAAADPALTRALHDRAPDAHLGRIVSVDLFYEHGPPGAGRKDALAVEMEAATLFALGARKNIPVACVLAVSDTFDGSGGRERIEDHVLLETAERMGSIAIAALS
jgi:nucleoside phosphorylase